MQNTHGRTNNPLVTVIIPVYNVESYVGQCLESVVKQSYGNLEIIVVDDGSTDSSGSICNEFAHRDNRITVIHEDNRGLSGARNNGLRSSHGEWISFIDSDDYASTIYIETLLSAALNTSSSMARVPFGKPFIDEQGCSLIETRDAVPRPIVRTSVQMQEDLLYQRYDNAAQWGIYERKTLENDPFPLELYYEDLATIYRIVHRVPQVAMVECRELYAYRIRTNSLIRQAFRPIKAESAIAVGYQLKHEIDEWYPQLAAASASRCFSLHRMVFAQIPIRETKTRNAIWQWLRHFRLTVLKDNKARSRERLAAGIAFLGMWPFTCFCSICRRLGLMR